MRNLIKIELYKSMKAKYFIFPLIIMALSLLLSIYITYYDENYRNSFPHYMYYSITANNVLVFTIASAFFFGSTIIKEYSNKTMRILYCSKYKREEIIMAKFLASVILFSLMFIAFTVLSYAICAIIIFINSNQYTIVNGYMPTDVILRFVLTIVTQLTYSMCIGALIFVFGSIFKNFLLSFLSLFLLILLYGEILFPEFVYRYSFISSSNISLYFLNTFFPISNSLIFIMSNIVSCCILLLILLRIIKKQQIL